VHHPTRQRLSNIKSTTTRQRHHGLRDLNMTNKTNKPTKPSFLHILMANYTKEEQQIKSAKCFCGTSAQLGSISKKYNIPTTIFNTIIIIEGYNKILIED
jgi:hypothetical protein